MPDTPTQPESGHIGEDGELGNELRGGAGGTGGSGGRGGMGKQGIQGETGLQGLTGNRGLIGHTGQRGLTGDAGQKGLRGQTGITGDAGQKGLRGQTGATGDIGLTGLTGEHGIAGGIGEHGIAGDTGQTGLRGDTGDTGARGQRGKTGTVQTRFDRYALGVVVIITALSAIYFATTAQHRLTETNHLIANGTAQQRAADLSAECRQHVFEETIIALKARSTFAEIQAHATLVLLTAQRDYLKTIILPNQTRGDRLAALATYQKALQFNLQATADQLAIHDRHPYPLYSQVKACRSQ